MKENQRGFASIIFILIIVGLVGVVGFFVFQNNQLKQETIQTQSTSNIPTLNNLTQFADNEISGFSFQYDSEIWFIEINEDLKYCGGAGCSPSHGKSITVTHNRYKDYPQKISLIIQLSDEVDSMDEGIAICFISDDIEEIGNKWYRAKNPSISSVDEQRDNLWNRYFYRSESIRTFNDLADITSPIKTTCDRDGIINYINGSLNITGQPVLPIMYKEKPTILNVLLQNSVSVEMSNIADEVVKSISFTQ